MVPLNSFLFFVLFFCCFCTCAQPEGSTSTPTRFGHTSELLNAKSTSKIIIIIDDLGYRRSDIAAFALPVEVTFSVLPQTPFSTIYANKAHAEGRDVMLHLPMSSHTNKALGPSAIKVGMFHQDIEHTLTAALQSVPHVIGVNNHMGSALTEQNQPMVDLMRALKRRDLFFIDSWTSPRSVAYDAAVSTGVAAEKRHVFLDHFKTKAFYTKQFDLLIRIAKKHGRAIGIAHPYPSSIAYLSERLSRLDDDNVELVPVSTYFNSFLPKKPTRSNTTHILAGTTDD